MTKFLKVTLCAAVVFIGFGLVQATPASAQDEIHVRFDARHLNTQTGTIAVLDALTERAETACAQPGRVSLADARVQRDCTDALVRDLVAKIGHEGLSQVANAR